MPAPSAVRTPWRELALVSGSARSAERSLLEVPGLLPPPLLWLWDLPSRDFAAPRSRLKLHPCLLFMPDHIPVCCKHRAWTKKQKVIEKQWKWTTSRQHCMWKGSPVIKGHKSQKNANSPITWSLSPISYKMRRVVWANTQSCFQPRSYERITLPVPFPF